MKFLAVQSTYDSLQFALLSHDHVIESVTISKFKASTEFLTGLQTLLSNHATKLSDLSFIAVNQGPAPFTTLRVVMSSINGLGFASHIPLIGVEALDACMQEWHDSLFPHSIVLLNAFGNDVYYALSTADQTLKKGCKNITALLEDIKELFPESPVRFLGNGALLHRDLISKIFKEKAVIETQKEYCNIKQIGTMGYEVWQKNHAGSNRLLPVYLKNDAF